MQLWLGQRLTEPACCSCGSPLTNMRRVSGNWICGPQLVRLASRLPEAHGISNPTQDGGRTSEYMAAEGCFHCVSYWAMMAEARRQANPLCRPEPPPICLASLRRHSSWHVPGAAAYGSGPTALSLRRRCAVGAMAAGITLAAAAWESPEPLLRQRARARARRIRMTVSNRAGGTLIACMQ